MNYKILYFAFVSSQLGGVEQKIIAQFDAFVKLGAEIKLYLVSSFTPGETLAFEIKKRAGVSILINSPAKIRNPWVRRKGKFDLISSVLSDYNPKSTIVYFRYPIADIFFLRFLKKNKAFRFITEHQDIENVTKQVWKKSFEILWGESVRKMITGFVGVTTEITNFEKSFINDQGHYYASIGNGIDTYNRPLRYPRDELQSNEIRILFVGAGYKPQGLSRLIWSIYLYYKNKNNLIQIYLKVAGDSQAMNKNRNLVKRLKLNTRVCFLGNLGSKDLNELFDWAQIGCGTLAIHKKGLNFTSELKAREYCARGLPFFWSTSDQDFNPDFPYVLKVPKSNGSFSLDPVISFVYQLTTDNTHPSKMRQYAIEYLDWSVKMKELITFFDEIIKNSN